MLEDCFEECFAFWGGLKFVLEWCVVDAIEGGESGAIDIVDAVFVGVGGEVGLLGVGGAEDVAAEWEVADIELKLGE